MQGQVTAQEALAAACCAQAAAIDAINIAITNESQCVAELNAINMDTKATTKSQLANSAQALAETATRNHEGAVNAPLQMHGKYKRNRGQGLCQNPGNNGDTLLDINHLHHPDDGNGDGDPRVNPPR
jgi:hypothetical protein